MTMTAARSLSEFAEASWAGSGSLEGLGAVVRAIADGARMVQERGAGGGPSRRAGCHR